MNKLEKVALITGMSLLLSCSLTKRDRKIVNPNYEDSTKVKPKYNINGIFETDHYYKKFDRFSVQQ